MDTKSRKGLVVRSIKAVKAAKKEVGQHIHAAYKEDTGSKMPEISLTKAVGRGIGHAAAAPVVVKNYIVHEYDEVLEYLDEDK